MIKGPHIGLLPLYLRLYDDQLPENRKVVEGFLSSVVGRFLELGVKVDQARICREAAEFETAVASFEEAGVDCIVSLHLAYSPSLEAVGVLTETSLPIVMLDTTMDRRFGQDVSPERIMYNHGVHGVMDLASVLKRHGKVFQIVAGHLDESEVLQRTVGMVRAAKAARCFRASRALRIGDSFHGMGDFLVSAEVLHRVLGVCTQHREMEALTSRVQDVSPQEIHEEVARDRERFVCSLSAEAHERSVRVGLGLRRLLEEGEYSSFSLNFSLFDDPEGPLQTVPFLEIAKAMERGIGYAGEGDVLTACLVGALSRAFGETTFTEVFCPDWEGNSLFLSHMGEINPEVAAGRPLLIEKPFPFTKAYDPAALTCALKPGPAVYVNLAPGPDDSFSLIVVPVEVLPDKTDGEWLETIRGWIRPECGVAEFLEANSRNGGTHHAALVFGRHTGALLAVADFLGIESCVIR